MLVEVDIGRAPGRVGNFSQDAKGVARGCGIALTLLGGPMAMAFAHLVLGMGALESGAVLLLLSGWIGPKLIGGWHAHRAFEVENTELAASTAFLPRGERLE